MRDDEANEMMGLGAGLVSAALGTPDCVGRDFLGICQAVADASTVTELVLMPLAGALAGGLIGRLFKSTRWVPATAPTRTPGRPFGGRLGWSISVR